MGIYDREYFSDRNTGAKVFLTRTVVGQLIALNIAIFLIDIFFDVNRFLVCTTHGLFDGFPQFWTVLTATFAHADPHHILFNMLLLFFFGRELEEILGKKDFLFLYLVAGSLSIFAEAAMNQATNGGGAVPDTTILGASGAIMAIVVLFACFYPNRQIGLLFLPIRFPVWVLCAFIIFIDVVGALGGGSNVAHWAHLAGAAYGFLYYRFDLRWTTLTRRIFGQGRRRRPSRRRPARNGNASKEEWDAGDEVSRRIDALLEKISHDGMESLTDEERRFLHENSNKYRSS